jgi:hypothetical protein
MALIVPSELAPAEEVSFSFADGDLALGGGGTYETDNRGLLAEAEAHPWLAVEYDEAEVAVATYRPDSVAPEDDALSALNSEAFDVAAIKRDRDLVLGDDGASVLALDAGLDQKEVLTSDDGAFNFTLAADDENSDTRDSD